MGKPLVIVESPTKARTISKFLGNKYRVEASIGHIRDLPSNAAEIPEKYKKQAWARLGVDIENNFHPLYVIPDSKKQQVKKLKEQLKDASILYLATDEDREGESISWHLVEVLNPKVPVKRLVFHEITQKAIQDALEHPRDVNKSLVAAQEARRIVDRIYGYCLSPLLWKKIRPKLSAGRVQSVAIRLIVEREMERVAFVSSAYWDAEAKFADKQSAAFVAKLIEVDGKRVAIGKDFDPNTGKLKPTADVIHLLEKDLTALAQKLQRASGTVTALDEKPYSAKPAAPFTTSSMQQEANRRLRFSAQRTMQIAQKLYENGHITYMRTDSTTLSDEAIKTARELIKDQYGKDYLPASAREYKTKVKNAQEAHEAIRPAGHMPKPESLRKALDGDQFRLYEMIWMRTIASQMQDARGKNTKLLITVDNTVFQATGKTIEFPGYQRAYVEGVDDPDGQLAEQERILPKVSVGQSLTLSDIQPQSHTTQPPARLTEATLVKELEARGIGRPSTYASIIQTILNREYVFKKGNALVPTYTAFSVVNLLKAHMSYLVDYAFTAKMEDDLDEISLEKVTSEAYLKSFYFGNANHPGLEPKLKEAQDQIDPRVVCSIPVGTAPDGELVEVRVGRYGPFLSKGDKRCQIPDKISPDELTLAYALELLQKSAAGPKTLGTDPETGLSVYILTGRFGPYVQLGEMTDPKDKPKRSSLLKDMNPDSLDLETALKLLSLPREVGVHPETKEKVLALNGPYGPYVQCGKDRRSIPAEISVLEINLDQALEVLKQPPRRAAAGRRVSSVLKELGADDAGNKIRVMNGRFGPYVTDGTLNASLPKGTEVEEVTVSFAQDLLKARAEKGPSTKKRRTVKKKTKSKSKK